MSSYHEVSKGNVEQISDAQQHSDVGFPSEERRAQIDEILKRALQKSEIQPERFSARADTTEVSKGNVEQISDAQQHSDAGLPSEERRVRVDEILKRALQKSETQPEQLSAQADTTGEKTDNGHETAGEKDAPETRKLTEEEWAYYKEKLGWKDKQLNKCTIDENGTIHYRTNRADMEGKTNDNGVRYERKTVEIHGIKVEGVFPVFESTYDVKLPKDLETASNAKQFKECNRQLKDAVDHDPELKAKFTEEQLQDIEEEKTLEGYTWHHNEETGKMQLVKVADHDLTQSGAAHTGGKALWGGGY